MIDLERTERKSQILIPLFFALLFFGLGCPYVKAQGGPPYMTNDPVTPGNKQWEINVGYIPFYHKSNWSAHIPDVDINYGLGDSVQLTYEISWATLNTPPVTPLGSGALQSTPGNVTIAGMGQGQYGVKWHFLESEKYKFGMGVFPQVSLNYPNHAIQRGIVPPGASLILPVEFTKKVGPVDVNWEVGYNLVHLGPDGYLTGVVVGRDVSKNLELDAEFYATGAFNGTGKQTTLAGGARYKIHPPLILLLMAGRSIVGSTDSQPYFLGYFGMQFLLPPHPFEHEQATAAENEPATAEGPSIIDASAGFSYIHTSGSIIPTTPSSLNGGTVSATYYPYSWFGAVAEYGAYARSGATAQTLLFGPRVAIHRESKLVPFGQVLVGFVWSNDQLNGTVGTSSASTKQNFATSLGVGLDLNVSRHVTIRLGQVDYLLLRQPTAAFNSTYSQNDFRYSTGIVFRFFGPKSAR